MRRFVMRPPSSPAALCLAAASLIHAGCSESRADEAANPQRRGVTHVPCGAGQTDGPDGGCMPVGIQGCAEQFLSDDDLCHPSMSACPAGTIPKFDEGCVSVGISRCAPAFLGEDGLCRPTMAKCPQGTFAAPEAGCVPIDGPEGCGDGRFGAIPDIAGAVYVDPGRAAPGGDGSRGDPLSTLARAMALVAGGGTIVLAEGVYDEALEITSPIAIVGRCPSRVRLAGTRADRDVPTVVRVDDAGAVSLRNLSIGGDGVGLRVTGASDVRVDRVHIDGAVTYGVAASGLGARVSVSQSLIEGTRSGETDAGIGAHADSGATISIASSAVVGNRVAGVAVQMPGTRAEVSASLIEGTLPGESARFGEGVLVDQAEASLERSALVANRMEGVLATRGGAASLRDVLIEGTLQGPNDGPNGATYGMGAKATAGSRLAIVSSHVLGNVDAGVAALGGGAEATLTGSLVQGTTVADRPVLGGSGVFLGSGGRVELRASVLWQNHAAGADVGDGAELVAEGSLFEGNLPSGPFGEGAGVSVTDGRAEITSSAMLGNAGPGLSVGYVQSRATLTDSLVVGGEGTAGHGVRVFAGARATLDGDVVRGNRRVGVFIGTDDLSGEVAVTGSLVEDTTGEVGDRGESDDSYGIGIAASGYTLTLASSVVRRNRDAGVLLFGANAELRGSLVEGWTGDGGAGGRQSGADTGPRGAMGDGLLALAGSRVRVRGLRVSGCSRAGILSDDSSGSLAGIIATRNLFGLVVQGAARPEIGGDSELEGNTERDQVTDGDLPVPLAPPQIP